MVRFLLFCRKQVSWSKQSAELRNSPFKNFFEKLTYQNTGHNGNDHDGLVVRVEGSRRGCRQRPGVRRGLLLCSKVLRCSVLSCSVFGCSVFGCSVFGCSMLCCWLLGCVWRRCLGRGSLSPPSNVVILMHDICMYKQSLLCVRFYASF